MQKIKPKKEENKLFKFEFRAIMSILLAGNSNSLFKKKLEKKIFKFKFPSIISLNLLAGNSNSI